MTDKKIDFISARKRLKLSAGQIFNHYSVLIIPSFFLFVTYNFSNIIIGVWLVISILIILKYRNKLNFREFKGTFKNEDIIEALNRTFRERNFEIAEKNDRYILAYSSEKSFNSIPKTQICVIFDKEKFLINSIKNPDNPFIQLFAS